jgi:hypothetical protein
VVNPIWATMVTSAGWEEHAMREPFNEQDAEALANLTAVQIDQFEADPPAILPFGESTLRWRTSRVGPSVAIELSGEIVAPEGTRLVAPELTRTYVLRARSGRLVRTLGQVTVAVDVGACTTVEVFRLGRRVFDAIMDTVNDICDPDGPFFDPARGGCSPAEIMDKADDAYLKLRDRWVRQGPVLVRDGLMQPIVRVTDSGVDFQLALTVVVAGGPDLGLDVNAGFGIEIESGTLRPTYRRLDADASFPGWVWLIPGSMIAGPIALGSVEDKAREQVRAAIDGSIAAMATGVAQAGMRFHSVEFISDERENDGRLDITLCPTSASRVVDGRPDLAVR